MGNLAVQNKPERHCSETGRVLCFHISDEHRVSAVLFLSELAFPLLSQVDVLCLWGCDDDKKHSHRCQQPDKSLVFNRVVLSCPVFPVVVRWILSPR